jgi:hypothetical protein
MVLGLEQYLLMSGLTGGELKELANAKSLIRLAPARTQVLLQYRRTFSYIQGLNFSRTLGKTFVGKTHLWTFLG